MQILALGLDHHRASVELRERLAIPSAELPAALVVAGGLLAEAVILSTCNRTELYALVGHRESGRRTAARLLADLRGVPLEELAPLLVDRWEDDAAGHLFRVAAGMESMIVGEGQILGQVRAAIDAARAARAAGPVLTRLFNDALTVGKRARTESGIARSAVSVSTAAVELARKALGTLAGRSVLVIGAGEMGSLTTRALSERGASRIVVTSRSETRAAEVAARVGGEVLPFERLGDGLALGDIAISSSAAPGYIVTREVVEAALARRPERPLVLIDIAVPRDVEPSVRELAGCTLHNIDDLRALRDENLAQRRREALKVKAIIAGEVEKFTAWRVGREVAPTIAELVGRADLIRVSEQERALARMGPLSERDRNLVNAMTTAIVNKILHHPIVQLKQRGGHHDAGVYVHAVRELFDLPRPERIGD